MSDATIEEVLTGTRRNALLVGDCLDGLRSLPDGCVQTCVTSPPYYGLRDYGNAAQIGKEPTPREFVEALVAVFAEVRRVLSDDGTLWLNLGDSYAQAKGHGRWENDGSKGDEQGQKVTRRWADVGAEDLGLKPKDLVGIPWMVAFALRADGWYLRSDIIWAKGNPMPESVTDRPTRSHEYIFLLTKSREYFYDHVAVKEPVADATRKDMRIGRDAVRDYANAGKSFGAGTSASRRMATNCVGGEGGLRNQRSVWTINPKPYKGAHFATMPPELARRCILAGSRRGDVVLDPFAGAGTTALVAVGNGRRAIGCELNPEYARIALDRVAAVDTDVAEPVRVVAPQWGALFDGAAK